MSGWPPEDATWGAEFIPPQCHLDPAVRERFGAFCASFRPTVLRQVVGVAVDSFRQNLTLDSASEYKVTYV